MTDQTESASEYAELLVRLDCDAAEGVWFSGDAALAIRALEAKAAAAEAAVQELEYRLAADGVREMQDELTYLRAKVERLSKAWEAADRNLQWMAPDLFQLRRDHEGLRAERDRLAGEVERLEKALEEREGDMHMRIRAGYDSTVADSWRAEVARLAAEVAALREDAANVKRDVADAYGWLWCVNEEPGTPNRFPAERAAYNARKMLRELLTHEQRGIGINKAVIQRDAARRAGEGE